MALRKEERRSVSHEKVENGFLITLEVQKKKANGEWDFKSKKFISSTATETEKMLTDLLSGELTNGEKSQETKTDNS